MNTLEYSVPNISCGHCVNTIQTEIGDLDGVISVVADHASKKVNIEFGDPATEASIIEMLKEINYAPVLA